MSYIPNYENNNDEYKKDPLLHSLPRNKVLSYTEEILDKIKNRLMQKQFTNPCNAQNETFTINSF